MSTQIEFLTRDIIANHRTGTLSGRAIYTSQPSKEGVVAGTKAFSILYKSGHLVMCQYANKEGYGAIIDLLNSESIVKISWFAMREDTVSTNEAIISNEQLLSMFVDRQIDELQPQAAIIAENNKRITLQAREVFTQFFSDAANSMINRVIKTAGPQVSTAELTQLYINELAPLLGQDGAAAYFQK